MFAANQRYLGNLPVPEGARLVGYAALSAALGTEAATAAPAITFDTHTRRTDLDEWAVVPARQAPVDTFQGHLDFALHYERLDLALLKAVFNAVDRDDVEEYCRARPTGAGSRRAWFLYEWLTERDLRLPDAKGNYVPVLDPADYVVPEGVLSRRHHVVDNMGGTPAFCPLIRRPKEAESFQGRADDVRARIVEVQKATDASMLRRAASSLLLGETITTFAIEGLRPPRDKIERWGKAMLQAGRTPLDETEITRLQHVVLADALNEPFGYREKQNFVGSIDPREYRPLPERVNPRPEDVRPLMSAWEDWTRNRSKHLDAVTAAAVASFSFVYIHPLIDGNGRMHRYILHHVMAERGYTPRGLIFPMSMPIMERTAEYKAVLSAFDERVMPATRWRETGNGGVEVLNDVSDFYRYPDMTAEASFIHDCVLDAALTRFPKEIRDIGSADRAIRSMGDLVDMSDERLRNFLMYTRQNNGTLPKKRAKGEFKDLEQETILRLEAVVDRVYGNDEPGSEPQTDSLPRP